MYLEILVVAFVVAIGLFFLIRSKAKKSVPHSRNIGNVATQSSNSENTRWRSVKIQPGLIACASVSKIANRVFLATEAPSLPLGVCIEKSCQCKYVHLKDRRSSEDRRSVITQISNMFADSQDDDRRVMTGRRVTDMAA